jgi:hypothetical protein
MRVRAWAHNDSRGSPLIFEQLRVGNSFLVIAVDWDLRAIAGTAYVDRPAEALADLRKDLSLLEA